MKKARKSKESGRVVSIPIAHALGAFAGYAGLPQTATLVAVRDRILKREVVVDLNNLPRLRSATHRRVVDVTSACKRWLVRHNQGLADCEVQARGPLIAGEPFVARCVDARTHVKTLVQAASAFTPEVVGTVCASTKSHFEAAMLKLRANDVEIALGGLKGIEAAVGKGVLRRAFRCLAG